MFHPKSNFSIEYDLFLQELRDTRARVHMTQIQLANKLKKHQTYISKCESGVRRLDVIELLQWTWALGVPFQEFCAAVEAKIAAGIGIRKSTSKRH